MKLNVLALALAAAAFTTAGAFAQTTIIEETRSPAVVVEPAAPDASVTVHTESKGVLGIRKRSTTIQETTGAGGVECRSKTVHDEGLLHNRTHSKTECD